MKFVIRKLGEPDWKLFADLRLRALRSDPAVFGSTFEAEQAQTDDEWKAAVSDESSAIFGLFCDAAPIGVSAISVYRQDPTGMTAILWGTWIEPEHRGKGLSEMLYRARLEWASEQRSLARVIVSHRESNLASRKSNQKFGFSPTEKTSRVWPDGKREAEHHYELVL